MRFAINCTVKDFAQAILPFTDGNERDLLDNSIIVKDLAKIKADTENIGFIDIPAVTPNGLIYQLAYMGGDWENPIHFIVYLDNNKAIRAYIPKNGNTYNLKTKAAYGYEDTAIELAEEAEWNQLSSNKDGYEPWALARLNNREDIDLPAFLADIDQRIIVK